MANIGSVMAVAIKTEKRGPMREIEQATLLRGGGIQGDQPSSPDRGITLISMAQWEIVNSELQANLPWHTRRANVLVDIPELLPLIGLTLRIGNVEVAIKGETLPCSLMDKLHPGLLDVLKPHGRAGVHGHIMCNGTIRTNDTILTVA